MVGGNFFLYMMRWHDHFVHTLLRTISIVDQVGRKIAIHSNPRLQQW